MKPVTKSVLRGSLALFCIYQLPLLWRGPNGRCCDSMDHLVMACEMYATDNSGRYPTRLTQVSAWPVCPLTFLPYEFSSGANPDQFTIRCRGEHFRFFGFRSGYPHFSSGWGWTVAPDNYPGMRPDDYLWLSANPQL